MYDANSGRWLEEDPIGFEAGDTDLYRYVFNDPTSLMDPSGLYPDSYSGITINTQQPPQQNNQMIGDLKNAGKMAEVERLERQAAIEYGLAGLMLSPLQIQYLIQQKIPGNLD